MSSRVELLELLNDPAQIDFLIRSVFDKTDTDFNYFLEKDELYSDLNDVCQ